MPKSRIMADTLPGERWAVVPGWLQYEVSDLGRIKSKHVSLRGRLVHPVKTYGTLWFWAHEPNERAGRRLVSLGGAVLAAFRSGSPAQHVRYLNEDTGDCRLTNLRAGQRRKREGFGADHPWTPEHDAILRSAKTITDVAHLTGHTAYHVRRRMQEIGVRIRTRRSGDKADLHRRDLDAVGRCVEVLELAGVADADINIVLGVKHVAPAHRTKPTERCIRALLEAGVDHAEIRAAFGWSSSWLRRWLNRVGAIDTHLPQGWTTKKGPADSRDGEVWRPAPGFPGYQVSNLGGLRGKTGGLLSPRTKPCGAQTIALWRDGKLRGTTVTKLVIGAFKPGLIGRRFEFLNGDRSDASAANLVPWSRGRRTVDHRAIWNEAIKAIPAWADPDERQDLASAIVVIMSEGRADTVKSALPIARRERAHLMGVHKEISLDAERGDGGFTLGHLLTSEGEMMNRSQARSGRT